MCLLSVEPQGVKRLTPHLVRVGVRVRVRVGVGARVRVRVRMWVSRRPSCHG